MSHIPYAVPKGLSKLWMARYLDKQKIDRLNIVSACQAFKNIVDVVPYRISGILIEGLAVVYERKVNFLFEHVKRCEEQRLSVANPTVLPEGEPQARNDDDTLSVNEDGESQQTASTTMSLAHFNLTQFINQINPANDHQADPDDITLRDYHGSSNANSPERFGDHDDLYLDDVNDLNSIPQTNEEQEQHVADANSPERFDDHDDLYYDDADDLNSIPIISQSLLLFLQTNEEQEQHVADLTGHNTMQIDTSSQHVEEDSLLMEQETRTQHQDQARQGRKRTSISLEDDQVVLYDEGSVTDEDYFNSRIINNPCDTRKLRIENRGVRRPRLPLERLLTIGPLMHLRKIFDRPRERRPRGKRNYRKKLPVNEANWVSPGNNGVGSKSPEMFENDGTEVRVNEANMDSPGNNGVGSESLEMFENDGTEVPVNEDNSVSPGNNGVGFESQEMFENYETEAPVNEDNITSPGNSEDDAYIPMIEGATKSVFELTNEESRDEAALLFYVTLVSAHTGYISLQQDKPFDDIIITRTNKK